MPSLQEEGSCRWQVQELPDSTDAMVRAEATESTVPEVQRQALESDRVGFSHVQ